MNTMMTTTTATLTAVEVEVAGGGTIRAAGIAGIRTGTGTISGGRARFVAGEGTVGIVPAIGMESESESEIGVALGATIGAIEIETEIEIAIAIGVENGIAIVTSTTESET
mmetsp:Transcript_2037/g.4524  ORF Transcript_2037/g.4524 Transcript_2037/m.4524 type:complete len:111 (-) Transcript_2037:468-800(-)